MDIDHGENKVNMQKVLAMVNKHNCHDIFMYLNEDKRLIDNGSLSIKKIIKYKLKKKFMMQEIMRIKMLLAIGAVKGHIFIILML